MAVHKIPCGSCGKTVILDDDNRTTSHEVPECDFYLSAVGKKARGIVYFTDEHGKMLTEEAAIGHLANARLALNEIAQGFGIPFYGRKDREVAKDVVTYLKEHKGYKFA